MGPRRSAFIDLAAGRQCRVVAFDRPSFGVQQPARSVRCGLLRRPVVVGHSWGTLVALALALDHPEAVSGLILLSGYYHPTLRADVPLFSIPAIPVIGHLIRYTVGPFFGSALPPL